MLGWPQYDTMTLLGARFASVLQFLPPSFSSLPSVAPKLLHSDASVI